MGDAARLAATVPTWGGDACPDASPLVVLTVYFCGTAGVLGPPATTQIGLFFNLTVGADITHSLTAGVATRQPSSAGVGGPADEQHFKMGFDGCGETNGCLGLLFAHGLTAQCRVVCSRVQAFLAASRCVRLNVLGLSRGGMAAMKLTQMLSDIDPSSLEVNICLFDPVPGNLIVTAAVDWTCGGRISIARQSVDLSASRNLASALAIYPHEPLPALAFHAPIIPRYPERARCEELVTLGCHQGALWVQISLFDPSMR